MEKWTVTFTNREQRTVDIDHSVGNPMRDADRAMWMARGMVPGAQTFSAKPEACIGLHWNVHFGMEEACPVHRSVTTDA